MHPQPPNQLSNTRVSLCELHPQQKRKDLRQVQQRPVQRQQRWSQVEYQPHSMLHPLLHFIPKNKHFVSFTLNKQQQQQQNVRYRCGVNEKKIPVETPQLRRHIFSRGKRGSTLTTQAESMTVYSEKVDVLRKWKMGLLSLVVKNLVLPSLTITFFIGSTLNLSHRLAPSRLHTLQSPHSPVKIGST